MLARSSEASKKYHERIWEFKRNVSIQIAAILFAVGTGLLTFDLKVRVDAQAGRITEDSQLRLLLAKRMSLIVNSIAFLPNIIEKKILPDSARAYADIVSSLEEDIAKINDVVQSLAFSEDIAKSTKLLSLSRGINFDWRSLDRLMSDKLTFVRTNALQGMVTAERAYLDQMTVLKSVFERVKTFSRSSLNASNRSYRLGNKEEDFIDITVDCINKLHYNLFMYLTDFCVMSSIILSERNLDVEMKEFHDEALVFGGQKYGTKPALEALIAQAKHHDYNGLNCGEFIEEVMTRRLQNANYGTPLP